MENNKTYQKKDIIYGIFFVAMLFFGSGFWANANAANTGDIVNFNVDQNYDATSRSSIGTTLVRSTSSLYFYVETSWWTAQSLARQNEILSSFDALSNEFNNNIHPTLTSVFGVEYSPGIDRDSKITLVFESIKENVGGYFRSSDEYSKLQIPDSNEREMVYLPILQIASPQLKVFLAHEFVHLIVFNQKERLQGVQEEVWLSEARSDFSSTILGYDNIYEDSNLERRVQDFLHQPSDSLTEWQGTKYDYAVESLFMHYLVDHYGLAVLSNSVKSKLIGIPSINEALVNLGVSKSFSQIFTDWTIAMAINHCSQDAPYCYLNKNLTGLKINPTLIFLPLVGNSSLSIDNSGKNWAASWQKIIGGNGDLELLFSGVPGLAYQMPYIMYDKNNNYVIKFLSIDANGKGQISMKDFGTNYNALMVIPSLQSKLSGFNGIELDYPYTFTISIKGQLPKDDSALIQKLQIQIASLKKQIADILAVGGQLQGSVTCFALNNNLYVGVSNSADVSCLQQFLKSQGANIYPEGLITGVFGNLTKSAVINFQKKFNIPGTGFVGILTRQKINQLIAK